MSNNKRRIYFLKAINARTRAMFDYYMSKAEQY